MKFRSLVVLDLLFWLTRPALAQPHVVGQWSPLAPWPAVAVHAHLLPTGKVIFYPYEDDARIWDPVTNTFTLAARAGFNIFCGGHAFLPDGRLLAVGGHITSSVGFPHASIYDPFQDTWTRAPDMNAARWYPTATALSNGDVLVTAGSIDLTQGTNLLPQVWQVATNTWRDLTSAQLALDLYPWLHLAPDGRVIYTGPVGTTRYLDTSGTGSWTTIGSSNIGFRDYGTSVMYDTGKILIVGGGSPTTATAEVIDLNGPSPSWRSVGSMTYPRRQMNATVLPDGTVLATGGSSGGGFNNSSNAVTAAELWDPLTEMWLTMASFVDAPLNYRGYHSTALLLPDGRVLSAGGDGRLNAEIYSPPYLFKGPRPTVASVPSNVAFGESFLISSPDAADIAQVTLVRLSAVTHSYNMEQRFSRLSFTHVSDGLSVTAPTNPHVTPPGYYMLFLLNSAGVPSVAAMVRIGTSAELLPVAPENLAAVSSTPTRIDLTWQDASNNELVFSIERCQGAACDDFVEIARVAAGTTAFTSSALTPGTTYAYRVRAFNGAGYSPYTATVTATTTDAILPAAPTDLTVEVLSLDRIALRWTDNSSDEIGFKIERCTGTGCTTLFQIDQVAAGITVFENAGLAPGTTYRYRVRAFNIDAGSEYSNTVEIVTAPPAPDGLKTSAVSATAVALVWTLASDAELGFRIERCQGAGCLAFTVVGQVAANVVSFSDAGVSASALFRYQVRAFNASGESPSSNIVEVTTPPSAPANLTATAISQNEIALAWAADGGETGFRIERCLGTGCNNFSQIGELEGSVTTFASSGLSAGSTYRYRVRGFNSGGQSTYSNVAEAATVPLAPATPTGLIATGTSATQITLRWNDVAGDTGVRVERCMGAACTSFVVIGQVAGTIATFIDGGVAAATLYRYRVQAFNAGGDSLASNIAELTSPPSAPANMTATSMSASQINLAWSATGGESGFRIERCGGAGCTSFVQIAQTAATVTSYVNASLPPAMLLRYRVRAFTSGGQSTYSNTAEATTRPATPTGLVATATTATQFTLRWNDVAGDTGLRIERCTGAACTAFAAVGQVAGNVTTFIDSGVTTATLYRYRVHAFNAGGDSLGSNIAQLTSQPNAPTNTTATSVSASQINLTWAAAGGESGFRIERCTGAGCTAFVQIVQTAANVTSYVNTSLPAATLLRYRVRAFTTGGQSAYSNTAETTTRPATPGGLIVTANSPTQNTVRWNDVVGDTGVRIERCAGAGCTAFAAVGQVAGNVATFADSGVTAATLYRYRVRAFNTGGDSLASAIAELTSQPNVPTNLTAATMSASQINLAWSATGGEGGFRIERCTGIGCTAFAQIVQTAANVTSYVNLSLPPATVLRYRVRAFTTGGQSAYSNISEATTRTATPTGLVATTTSPLQITLRWSDVAGDTGVRVERCAGAACTNFSLVGQVAGNVATFIDTGVTAATLYRYRVHAFNAGGDSLPSSVVQAVTQ